jgi:hypothetical protein
VRPLPSASPGPRDDPLPDAWAAKFAQACRRVVHFLESLQFDWGEVRAARSDFCWVWHDAGWDANVDASDISVSDSIICST